jgi:NAD(P)-dependent dehydrogenase (short-subunit alcohol dehydrogenase family)
MRAIVTGAAGGIGAATARLLGEQAAGRGESVQIMLADLNREALDTLAAELAEKGAQTEVFTGDLSDPEVPAQLVAATVAAFGGLDTLISNAGIINRATLLELELEDFDRSFDINTRATWLLGKAAHPHLAAAGGALVATASISAENPSPPLAAYSASKAALVMLVRQMSIEWGPDGIRCNCVSPGSTHTAMTDARYSDPELRADAERRNPSRMVGLPEHQAAAIAFLASPGAAYINGANLLVDGGMQNNLMVASALGDPWKR